MKKYAALFTTALVLAIGTSAHADSSKDQALVNACMTTSIATAVNAVNNELSKEKGDKLVVVANIENEPILGRNVATRKLSVVVSVNGDYAGQYQINMLVNLNTCEVQGKPGIAKVIQ